MSGDICGKVSRELLPGKFYNKTFLPLAILAGKLFSVSEVRYFRVQIGG